MGYNEPAVHGLRTDRSIIDQVKTLLHKETRPYLVRRLWEVGRGMGNLVAN